MPGMAEAEEREADNPYRLEASSGDATFVAVVQTTHLGERHDLACAGWLDGSGVRRVLAEREVRARAVVVREVRLEDRPQVGFA
jgi:hypothetical protein